MHKYCGHCGSKTAGSVMLGDVIEVLSKDREFLDSLTYLLGEQTEDGDERITRELKNMFRKQKAKMEGKKESSRRYW